MIETRTVPSQSTLTITLAAADEWLTAFSTRFLSHPQGACAFPLYFAACSGASKAIVRPCASAQGAMVATMLAAISLMSVVLETSNAIASNRATRRSCLPTCSCAPHRP